MEGHPKDRRPEHVNIFGGRFVLSLKTFGAKDEKEKAQYKSKGHKDKDKQYMVHDFTLLRSSSIISILSVAAIK